MATINEITQLRREGKIDEALALAKTMLAQSPSDRYARTTMAWCLKAKCEMSAKSGDYTAFLEAFKHLPELRLGEIGEQTMANRFSWDMKTLFDALARIPEIALSTASQIIEVLPRLSFKKPDKYYTLLADVFMKVRESQNSPWQGFIPFMDWFDFDNFMPEDYQKIPLSNGKSMPSVAERAYSNYYKTLAKGLEQGKDLGDTARGFVQQLKKVCQLYPQFQYIPYHRALLLIALGEKDEARKALLPFIKRRGNEFWVWDALCDTSDDPEVKLSCLCRALMCKTDPNFLGKVHIKAAQLMHELGHDGNARAELRAMQKTYSANGWNIPREAVTIARNDWYQSAIAADNNLEFYKNHLGASEQFLYMDIPETEVLVTYLNREKKICNFITNKRKRGFFSFKGIKVKLFENEILRVRFDAEVSEDKPMRILTLSKPKDISQYVGMFFKKIEGRLNIRDAQQFGFVGDIFVSPDLCSCLSDGDNVSGTAVLTYNRKKESYGWKAVKLNKQP